MQKNYELVKWYRNSFLEEIEDVDFPNQWLEIVKKPGQFYGYEHTFVNKLIDPRRNVIESFYIDHEQIVFAFSLQRNFYRTDLDHQIEKNEVYLKEAEKLQNELFIKVDSGRVPFDPWTGTRDGSIKLWAWTRIPYDPERKNSENGEFPPAHFVTFCRGVLERIRKSARPIK